MASDEVELAVIRTKITYISDKLDKVDTKLSNNYVSKEEFEPIKKGFYTLVSLILVAVVGAVISQVIK